DLAAAIGKDPSVVSRELKRNSDSRNGVYTSNLVQRKSEKCKVSKRKYLKFTKEIKLLVDSLLQMSYSPEPIKGRISLLKGVMVSVGTIYKYI
ncbi:MAG: IS30 family transposase, partial [Tannerellaceae bacterium]